jgi:hypothetical protein
MDIKKFIFGLLILIIPLIIIILLYSTYTYNMCSYNNQCTKRKLIKNIDDVSNYLNNKLNYTKEEPEQQEEVVEGFFSGIADWFYGSTPNNLNSDFPPEAQQSILKGQPLIINNVSPDEMKDSNNNDLLNSLKGNTKKIEEEIKQKLGTIQNNNVEGKQKIPIDYVNISNKTAEIPLAYDQNQKITTKDYNPLLPYSLKDQALTIPKRTEQFTDNYQEEEQQDQEQEQTVKAKNPFGKCNFYNDACPSDFTDLGNFSINGMESNMTLTCGNVQNTKPASAIARIKNNAISEIVVTNPGQGFNPSKPPKITIEGGKGNGAQVTAVIDDDGYLKIITIIHPGYNYTETPNVIIENPLMNGACHLCCKM